MDRESNVLQQGIQVLTFPGNGKHPLKGIGGEDQEKQETDADHTHDREYPCGHGIRDGAAEDGYRTHPQGEYQHPEQQGTLMSSPHPGNPVDQGQLGVGMIGHIGYREIVAQKCGGQAGIGECDEQQLGLGRRTGQGDPG